MIGAYQKRRCYMKISYRSVLLWGLAALVCIFLLSMRTYAGEAGPGAGLPEYSNNHGGILYQGDPKNETGDAGFEIL